MLGLATALVIASLAQATAPSAPSEIVVTGRRLQDTARALEQCIARRCPPREDVAATLAHAENLFVAGEYRDAQQVATDGIRRNKPYRARYPVEVSNLQRARARLSDHLGQADRSRFSTFDMVDSLRAGLRRSDARVLAGRLELADTFARAGRIYLAEEQYRKVAADARAADDRQTEGFALARHSILLTVLASVDPDYRPRARAFLRELSASPVPEHKPFAEAARQGLRWIALKRGDKELIDAYVAEYAAAGGTATPTLLYAEPIRQNPAYAPRPLDAQVADPQAQNRRRVVAVNGKPDWIDVGFLIDANGRPGEIDVIRSSNAASDPWEQDVVRSIATRRYAPLKLDPHRPGLYRIERYTRTWPLSAGTGSRIPAGSIPNIVMTDLSVDTVADTRPPDPAS